VQARRTALFIFKICDIISLWKTLRKKSKIWKNDSSIWRTVFDLAKKEKKLEELEKELQRSDLWKNKQKAAKISQEAANLKQELETWQNLNQELEELRGLEKIADEKLEKELEEKIQGLEEKIKKEEFQIFLSGKYDRRSAILQIFSGAGGKDAQDWATMLLRMYERYCQRKGFKTQILSQSFGEGGGPQGRIGTKQVSLEVKGNFAFGFLKGETGVHRLVRISPFSPQSLRHTSFALVEVIPEIPKELKKEIEIRPEDLKIEFYRASGPGGQYVNKKETAVRITHLPTKIAVTCQSQRNQAQNREKAMEILISKLCQLEEEKKKKEIKEVRGEIPSASWGNQIRSYVLHPYKLVKDLRTDVETTDIEGVLDGNLDQFIEAELKASHIGEGSGEPFGSPV
jgi:peptide chain release factor 2